MKILEFINKRSGNYGLGGTSITDEDLLLIKEPHPAKTWVDKTTLSSAVVISNLTIDSLGHPTDWVTRNLTPADIGAESAFSKGNVIQGAGITLSGTLTSRLVNTGDLTIAHADTSSQANISNTDGNVIQSLSFDTYGHVTTASSINLDNRYYTETEINTLLNNYQLLSEKGVANGYVPLDSSGKIPSSYIPDSILGQVTYVGTWNASTNTPTLPDPTTVKGDYYIVTTAGTYLGTDYQIGDWIISDGVNWTKVDNSDSVSSVFGRTGNVVAVEADYQSFYPRLSQVYSNPTWIGSLAWSKITGTPTTLAGYGITDAVSSNRTLTINGIAFDLTADRSWSVGTVTSVALSLPSIFSVTGSPITTSGTLAAALASQAANTVFAAPDGLAGAPTFRTLVAADIPTLDILTKTSGTLSVARGGTGATTLTGVLVGNGTSAVTAVTGTASQLLRRNADNTAYEFFTHDFINQAGARSAISLTTTGDSGASTYNSTTGVLNVPNYTLIGLGGFANPMTTLGDIIYGAASGTPTRLAGNTTTTRQFLSQTGTGTVSAIPAWVTITGNDVTGDALTKTDDTNVTLTLGGSPATALLRAASLTLGWTGQLAVGRGGTGASTLTGVVIGNGTSAMTAVAGTASQLLRRNAGNTAYEFFTHDFINQAGARTAISLTTIGTSGVATYNNTTGVFNIPDYTYTHPAYTSLTPTLTGANVLATFTTDATGHVTAATTRVLTPADISAEPAFSKGDLVQGAGITLTGTLASRLVGTGNITIEHADTSSQASVDNSNGTIIQDITLDTYGHITGLASLDGDARWARLIEVLSTSSVWSHVALQNGIDFTPYTTGSSGYPSTLGFAVAFYANTSDSTSGFGRAFALNREYNTENYYLGSPNTSGVHNGWRLIYHSGNLTLGTLGGVPTTRTITINGTSQDLSTDRTWTLTTTDIAEGTNLYFTQPRVLATPLTDYIVGTDTAIAATDTVLQAFQKVQGQINTRGLATADITAVSLTTTTLTLTRAAGDLTASVPTWNQNTTGSAATLTTPRTLTIGATGKTFDGSANVSWSLAEIGAIGGTIASGQVAFGTGVNTIGGDTGFTFDSSNDILTVGREVQSKSATGNLSFGMFEGNTATRTWGIYNVNSDHDFGIIRYGGAGNRLMFGIDRSTDAGFFNGKFAIGAATPLVTTTLRLMGNLDGAVTSWGLLNDQTIQSTVTTSARVFQSGVTTQAATFTLTDLYHFLISPSTFGAGSTVTNQYGFIVGSGLSGATNNYAFVSNLNAGANRWNLYMSGTANNYLAGNLWIGTISGTDLLDVNGTARIRTLANATGNFVTTSATGVLQQRTAAEVRGDINAQISGNYLLANTLDYIERGGVGNGLPLNFWNYGMGGADEVLWDYTKNIEYEFASTSAPNEINNGPRSYVFDIDHTFEGGKVIETSSYVQLYSDFIPVTPSELIQGEMWYKYISGTGGLIYYGVERYDSQKRPLDSNQGTVYFVASGVDGVNTTWTKLSGSLTIPSSHTPYLESDGGGVYYIRVRILLNYDTGGALRRYGGFKLTRKRALSSFTNDINAITGTGVSGQVAFFNGAGSVTGDTGFLWDNTNKRLGVNRTPTGIFDVNFLASGNHIGFWSTTILRFKFGGDGVFTWGQNAESGNNRGTLSWNTDIATISSPLNLGFITSGIERWRITSAGILQSNGAQTIQTSTGNLTLATAAGNGNIILSPNGTGGIILSKNVAIGAAIGGATNLYISKNIEGGTSSFGLYSDSIIQSGVTGTANYFRTLSRTVATAFTLPILVHYSANQGTFGDGSTVTTQYGFEVASTLIGATTNIGYYGNIPSGTNRWNIFMNGTALNYFNGNTLIGTTTDSGDKLRVNGTVRIDTINNLGSSPTEILVPSATGVISKRTLTELISDGGFVTLTGTQTITGVKTFNANFQVGDPALDNFGWDNTSKTFSIVSTAQYTHKYRGGAAGALNMGQFDLSGNASINNTSNAALLFATNNTLRLEIEADGDVLLKKVDNGAGNFVTIDPTTGQLRKRTASETQDDIFSRQKTTSGSALTLVDLGGGATYTLGTLKNYVLIEYQYEYSLRVVIDFTETTGTPSGAFAIGNLPSITHSSAYQVGHVQLITGTNIANLENLRCSYSVGDQTIRFSRVSNSTSITGVTVTGGTIILNIRLLK